MHYHNYNLSEIENMMPWERELYLNMILDSNKKEEAEDG